MSFGIWRTSIRIEPVQAVAGDNGAAVEGREPAPGADENIFVAVHVVILQPRLGAHVGDLREHTAGDVLRPPKPKVTGSNPVGRAKYSRP